MVKVNQFSLFGEYQHIHQFLWGIIVLLDLDLLLAKPKGAENPFLYYPESYSQDKSQSIITADNKYDLKRFSSHESSVIRQVIFTAFSKYSARL